ncbi:hypothetical protein BV20DRAFT_944697, partial [Pilatotrama ljubarskyi]
MPVALISVSRLAASGFQVRFERNHCHLTMPAGNKLTPVAEQNGLYPLHGTRPTTTPQVAETTATTLSDLEFHRRMGHAYPPILHQMVAHGVITGVDLEGAEVKFCDICQQAKQTLRCATTRAPFPKERSSPPSTRYGQRVHSDVWGKAQVQTWDGKQYFIMFLDD